jgi:hypothetical protein
MNRRKKEAKEVLVTVMKVRGWGICICHLIVLFFVV